MPYNYVADSISHKETLSRLSSSALFDGNGHFAYLSLLWGLGATSAVHVRLIGIWKARNGLPISDN